MAAPHSPPYVTFSCFQREVQSYRQQGNQTAMLLGLLATFLNTCLCVRCTTPNNRPVAHRTQVIITIINTPLQIFSSLKQSRQESERDISPSLSSASYVNFNKLMFVLPVTIQCYRRKPFWAKLTCRQLIIPSAVCLVTLFQTNTQKGGGGRERERERGFAINGKLT
jgi:hypothetical protein